MSTTTTTNQPTTEASSKGTPPSPSDSNAALSQLSTDLQNIFEPFVTTLTNRNLSVIVQNQTTETNFLKPTYWSRYGKCETAPFEIKPGYFDWTNFDGAYQAAAEQGPRFILSYTYWNNKNPYTLLVLAENLINAKSSPRETAGSKSNGWFLIMSIDGTHAADETLWDKYANEMVHAGENGKGSANGLSFYGSMDQNKAGTLNVFISSAPAK